MTRRNNYKSRLILVGFFILIVGLAVFLFTPLKRVKEEVFNDMRLAIYQQQINQDNDALKNIDSNDISSISGDVTVEENPEAYMYVGELSIPSIQLKRGFVSKDSEYNNINYNIQIAKESDYPSVRNGNFILMAHSGDAAISFFDSLYKLQLGDVATVSYQAKAYYYRLVKMCDVEKTGKVAIYRDYDKRTLTLITCTRNNANKQSIYIFEETNE